MAYRLRKTESIAKGLKRVVKKELQSAIDQLRLPNGSEGSVHAARKSIKKVRAVMELVGDEVRSEKAVKRLRQAGHLLSRLRDADAVIASARSLCDPSRKALNRATCSAVGELLKAEKDRLMSTTKPDRVKERAMRELERVRRSARHWDWNAVGFPELSAAIDRSYKNARRAMRKSRDRQRARTFHAWRKRVKTLWYGLRLLERRVPQLRRQLQSLESLESSLGEDHNLLMLQTQVIESRRSTPPRAVREQVRALAIRRQTQLRERALKLGTGVFRSTPKEFGRRLSHQWNRSS